VLHARREWDFRWLWRFLVELSSEVLLIHLEEMRTLLFICENLLFCQWRWRVLLRSCAWRRQSTWEVRPEAFDILVYCSPRRHVT
jgi:hypothetical protein